MRVISNWFLTLSPNTIFYINKEMYEETMKNSFNSADLYLRGQLESNGKTPLYILFKVSKLNDNTVVSKNNKKYKLLNKLNNYVLYEEAVKNKIPILYDWFIGKDQNSELRISGMSYEEGQMIPISEKIKSQNIDNSTLDLGSGDTVFVVWGSFNEYFKKHMKEISKSTSEVLLLQEPIDVFANKNLFPDLMSINNSILEPNQKVLKRAYQYRTVKKN